MYTELAILALFVFIYSMVAGGIERSPISGPMVFVTAGFLMGPFGLGWFDGNATSGRLRTLADLTLALILFIDAANADMPILKRQLRIPARMLLLGLPGAMVIGPALQLFSWEVVAYALLSLTVIRVLPIFAFLTGTGESVSSRLFLGWFGPRGLASIVFAIIVINAGVPEGKFLALVVICTVFMSLIAHGISAHPLAQWIGRKESNQQLRTEL